MPNESLITALQALREDYGQKQKATHNVIASLKGKSSAFGKIQQALGDYSAKYPGMNNTLAQVQQAFTAAQDNVNPLTTALTREAKALATFTGALKGAIAALSSDPVDVVKLSHPVEALQASEIQD